MRFVLIVAAVTAATPAAALDRSDYFQFRITDKQLYSLCTSQQTSQRDVCLAYITGVADRINFENYEFNKCREAFIAPQVGDEQLRAAVVKYMDNTQSSSSEIPALIDVHNAMIAFFPCPK